MIEEKKKLRAACLERRAAIPKEGKKRLDEMIRRRIAESDEFHQADTVLLYAPIRDEIDLLPLISVCRRRGKRVAFPVTKASENRMEFRYLADGARLVRSGEGYRIPEPPADAELCEPNEKTLCILPGLCFDRYGNRLGYGKGFYDRFLEQFEGKTMGAVYERLMVRAVPVEPHDHRVDTVIHERGRIDTAGEIAGEAKQAEPATHGVGNLLKSRIIVPLSQRIARFRLDHKGVQASRAESEEGADGTEKVRGRHAPPILVLATFLFLILSRLIEGNLTRRGSEYVAVILLQLMIFAVPALVYIQLRGDRFPARIRLCPIRPRNAWLCVCLLAVMITGSLLISIATGGISSLGGRFTLYDTFTARSDGGVWETVYLILAYALLPAVCEELIYRSVLCAEYEGAGVGVAVVVSALFFAMLHFSFARFPNYFFLGLLLSFSMYATRSSLAPMLLHFFYNLFCLFGQPYLSAFYIHAGSNDIFVFCLVVLLLLFAAFGAGEARKIYYLYAKENLSSAYTTPVSLRNYPSHLARSLLSPVNAALLILWFVMAIVGRG